MKHDKNISYEGGFEKLTSDLGNLTYDAFGEFLQLLSQKVEKDAKADEGRERHQLAKQLTYAAKHIKNAWKICEPYMD